MMRTNTSRNRNTITDTQRTSFFAYTTCRTRLDSGQIFLAIGTAIGVVYLWLFFYEQYRRLQAGGAIELASYWQDLS